MRRCRLGHADRPGHGAAVDPCANTHLYEFSAALRYLELVLMLSVSRDRVAEIEDRVQQYFPAVAIGGVGWSSDLPQIKFIFPF